jgi:Restriction endonuclease
VEKQNPHPQTAKGAAPGSLPSKYRFDVIIKQIDDTADPGKSVSGHQSTRVKTRLTPYYINLVYDACLKSFWRKKALSKFLRQVGISEAFVSAWGPDESKRDFLDRLFVELPKSDQGRSALIRMSTYLMDQQSFPDLQGWEDSSEKIKAANEAVSALRVHHSRQQDEVRSEENRLKAKKEFLKRQEEISRSQQTLQKLNDRLNAIGTQHAGYDFQQWFYDLLDFSEVPNRRPYVHNGRQIDGSVTVSATTYLIELKFTAEQVGAPDIDSFHKKVTTKADNTMGIMVSISGYSSIARQEASGERTPLLLLDHQHIYLILGGIMGFGEVVDRVRRHASQTGEAYLSVADFSG